MPIINVLHGGLEKPSSEQLATQSNKASGLTRGVVGATTAALGSIPKLAESIYNLGGSVVGAEPRQFYGTPENLRENIAPALGVSKESLNPEGNFEEFIDMISQDAPFIAASAALGGLPLLIPSLGRSAGANAGILGARELELGPLGEIAGSLIGAKVPGKVAQKISSIGKIKRANPQNLLTHMKDVTRNSYKQSDKLLKGVKSDASNLRQTLQGQLDDIATRFPTSENKQAIKNYDRTLEAIAGGKLDINEAKKLKQSFSNESYNKAHTPWIKETYRKGSDFIRDWIYDQESAFSGLGKNKKAEGIARYKRANELNTLVKSQEKFEKIIDENSSLSSLLDKSFLKSLFSYGIKKAGGKPSSRIYQFFAQPEAWDYYKDAITSLASNQEKEAIIALNKLGRKAIQFDKENKEEQTGPVKVISGGMF